MYTFYNTSTFQVHLHYLIDRNGRIIIKLQYLELLGLCNMKEQGPKNTKNKE